LHPFAGTGPYTENIFEVSMPRKNFLSPKKVSVSKSEITQVVLPTDGNPAGNILGGVVMSHADIVAAIAARRHAGLYVVTATVDHMDFRMPIHIGEIIILKSSVNRAFKTSMEVGVKVFRETIHEPEQRHTGSAYLTFVAVDPSGNPLPVPRIIPETADEKRRYREAGARRKLSTVHWRR
jgi:acyl-CoA hydrolase